ncbi:VOC family protein [Hoeflea poritis]|uniref:VOC family protein n=1 Tax=Hoeflea poritis TaxID=2993659 RepID=A0ABT4VHV2_9HYPH|nr:VOC family protein [Hoeflea poritis]MDA4844288.1 VOC family protein [Hoeflea poritis]
MPLSTLDHVNIVTSNLDEMVEWYTDVLEMTVGGRPSFPFPGAWLYAGDNAIVHLVGTQEERKSIEPKIEHYAITATGLPEFIARLESRGIQYGMNTVPDFPIIQVNIFDCDGNHIHIDFSSAELNEDLAARLTD